MIDFTKIKEKRAKAVIVSTAYLKAHPWRVSYDRARDRCLPTHKYGKRGIKFLMTSSDFEELWFRDKAYLMKKPTIDRIQDGNYGHYVKDNCRFVEMIDNLKKKGVDKFDKDGNFLESYISIAEAARKNNILYFTNLSRFLNGGMKVTIFRGFKWGYTALSEAQKRIV